jgi:glycerophosphoryl diester phosphodiesterase
VVTEIIAHRGGALLWPENSHIAVENAARLGVEQVQVDMHPTRGLPQVLGSGGDRYW